MIDIEDRASKYCLKVVDEGKVIINNLEFSSFEIAAKFFLDKVHNFSNKYNTPFYMGVDWDGICRMVTFDRTVPEQCQMTLKEDKLFYEY